MTFGASEPIYQTRKSSLLTGGGGGGGGSYHDGDIRVCMHACLYPQDDHYITSPWTLISVILTTALLSVE